VLIFDEVQSGFGRTGRLFGFEHYDIVPDLVCCGKGITSSMPLSAVLGPAELLDQYGPGSMSSTHGGHPVSSAAALANLSLLDDSLLGDVRENGTSLGTWFRDLQGRFPDRIGAVHGRGYVWGIHVTEEGTDEPDGRLAARVVEECFHRGLLMFAPVGPGHATIKVAPPLVTPLEALREGAEVIEASFESALGGDGT
jgi:4-aminobutyrate aminotransferase-like enzyme